MDGGRAIILFSDKIKVFKRGKWERFSRNSTSDKLHPVRLNQLKFESPIFMHGSAESLCFGNAKLVQPSTSKV
ncbi:hypothetical protein EUGRSUZ_E02923 [Eucalyptus grandis]|uniref:Uncharacterized protein n=2 Tax=Eucalyptus grandis TaxID=71139 RepID=A0ACC3KZM6_EUCGR|nr:hypothetical protein EUGRSUZ_E02923 [Eucalyptus grandis]